MFQVIAPKTVNELADAIASGGPFDVRGIGSKGMLGRSDGPAQVLSLKHFAGVAIYEPEELILEAGAATPLSEILPMLEERQQMLAFDPPDYSRVLGAAHSGSLGGMLATGFAGPRRIKAGSVRDHVLGVAAVSGRSEVFKGGARVVKNVTGYDVPKLMAGSWGTLAAMTSVIFKVLPKAETEQTILVPGVDTAQAVKLMSLAMQSSAEVSSAAFVPGEGAYLRLEGIPVSVAARRNALLDVLQCVLGVKADVLAQSQSVSVWNGIRDLHALGAKPGDVIWRISVAPTDAPLIAQNISDAADAQFLFDWAGGLIWVAMSDVNEHVVRGAFAQGHATLFHASEEARAGDVFQPQAAALAALSKRVKAAMDPSGKLNPGRMYRGV
jgi:glycolate oxidase FAD binding subunit